MAYPEEFDFFEEAEPTKLHTAEYRSELFDLEWLTREQIEIIRLLVRNYEIADIAKMRQTQPEQIDLVLKNTRDQTGKSLRELATMLIENGAILAPAPQNYTDEEYVDLGLRVEVKQPPAQPPEAAAPGNQPPQAAGELAEAPGKTIRVPFVEEAKPVAKDALEPEDEPEPNLPPADLTVEPEAEEPEPDITRQHLQEYLTWMYPNENLEERFELNTEDAVALVDAIKLAAKKHDNNQKRPGKRHITPAALEYADLWLQGNGLGKIAALAGKTEGTIRLSLGPYAEKIGSFVPLDELLEQAAGATR